MEREIEVSLKEVAKLKGDFAWIALALGILAYDIAAIRTAKVETMSSALWRSLNEPKKAAVAVAIWGVLTHHLFVNKNARKSYVVHVEKIKLRR